MPLTNADFGQSADMPLASETKGQVWVSEDTGDVSISDGTQWILLGTAGGGSGPVDIGGPVQYQFNNFVAQAAYRTYILTAPNLTATLPTAPPDTTVIVFKDQYTGGPQTIAAGGLDTVELAPTYPLNNADSVMLQYDAGYQNWMVI